MIQWLCYILLMIYAIGAIAVILLAAIPFLFMALVLAVGCLVLKSLLFALDAWDSRKRYSVGRNG
jgi:hypothetical protein